MCLFVTKGFELRVGLYHAMTPMTPNWRSLGVIGGHWGTLGVIRGSLGVIRGSLGVIGGYCVV